MIIDGWLFKEIGGNVWRIGLLFVILQRIKYLIKIIMAMAISNVPVLTGEAAETFVRKADEAMKHRGSIDFTEQRAEMKLILANARFE